MSRSPEDRKNECVSITGLTGTGKSRMAAFLADFWDRKIFIDPTGSFLYEPNEEEKEYVARSYDEFVVIWTRVFNDPKWAISVRFAQEEEYHRVFDAIWRVITELDHRDVDMPSFLVVVDECDMFSDAQWIEENLRHITKRGRHFGISVIAVCQFDSDTHRTFRGNATETLIYLQGMLSTDMVRRLKGAAKIRGEEIPEVQALKKHDTAEPPEEGVHFIACPEPFDKWLEKWEALAESEKLNKGNV